MTHPLENCVFVSSRLARKDDDPFEVVHVDEKKHVVDGLLGLHLDDYLSFGENVNNQKDIEIDPEAPVSFVTRMAWLNRRFRFGKWNFDCNMILGGCEVEQSMNHATINAKVKSYIRKLKPLLIERERRNTVGDRCTPREHSQLRALVGAMQWPAAQATIHAATSVSLAQARGEELTVMGLLEANRTLKLLKNNADIPTRFVHLGSWKEARGGLYKDASWASRTDKSSQGGFFYLHGQRGATRARRGESVGQRGADLTETGSRVPFFVVGRSAERS